MKDRDMAEPAGKSTSRIVSHRPQETIDFARRLLRAMDPPAVLALHGGLGSGKTCFVRGLGVELNVTTPITSPTFTIINEYAGTLPLCHMDLYRLNGPDEVVALGLDDYLDRHGVVAIEWAERAGDLLPPRTIHIDFEPMDRPNERGIAVRSRTCC